MTDKYPWMEHVCYEPRSTIEPARPAPIPIGWWIFLVLAALAIVCGGLAALSVGS